MGPQKKFDFFFLICGRKPRSLVYQVLLTKLKISSIKKISHLAQGNLEGFLLVQNFMFLKIANQDLKKSYQKTSLILMFFITFFTV